MRTSSGWLSDCVCRNDNRLCWSRRGIEFSSRNGKGHDVTVVFEEKNGQLTARWGLVGAGSLDGAPTLTNEGLTRPFESASMLSKRFTPTQQLPKKGGPILGGCF
jgi:hypothetical protein